MVKTESIKLIFLTALLIVLSGGSVYSQDYIPEEQKAETDSAVNDEDIWDEGTASQLEDQNFDDQDSGLLELNPSRLESPNPNYLRSKGAGNNPSSAGNGVYDVGSDNYGTMPQDVIEDSTYGTR